MHATAAMSSESHAMSDESSMPQLPGLLGWVLAACAIIGGILLGAIKLMYSKIEGMYATQLTEQSKQITKVEERCKQLEGHYDECNKDREQLRVQAAENRTRIELLECEVQALKK